MHARKLMLMSLLGVMVAMAMILSACAAPVSAPAPDSGAAAEAPASGETATLTIATVNNPDMQVMESMQAGCTAFLPKPIEIDRLLALIQRHARLEWIVGDSVPGKDPSAALDDDAPPLIPPPPDELAVLFDLAIKGELLNLRRRAAELAARDVAYRPFATQLEALVDNFDEENILTLIEQLENEAA